MWHFVQRSEAPDSELISSIRDLLEATSRWIIVTVTLLIIPALLSGVIWPDALARNLWLVVPVAVVTCALSLSLLSRHFALTQILWQAGLAATLVAVIRVFSLPEAGFLLMLLPMMAVATLGWPLALASEILIGMVSLWLYRGLVTPTPPASYGWIIVIGGGVSWAIAHATSHSLATATQWSFYSYREAREHVEEARNQRLELAQIQEDLLKANGELARMADRLRTVSAMAEEARQTKEEFVANVSHELRTPLNMIIGFSEMITQAPQVYGAPLPPALLADITAIQRNSRHLSKLVDDVLDLSQIDAGRMTLSRDWTDLRDIIDEAITAVTVLYDSKHLYLRAEIADDLPRVYCDETRVRQVLLNLLSNSGRFTARGGVTIRADRQDGKVVVSVADTGPGIAEEDQARLFQPFQQLDSSIRRQHGGSGLGLSISRRFVDMHGGKMWLESTLDEGTTFFFSLPIEDPVPMALGARGNAQRWFNRYRRYMPRTRGWKAPDPELVPRYVVLEEGAALQRLVSQAEDVEIIGVSSAEAAMDVLRRSPARALLVNAPLWETYGITRELLETLPYRTPAMLSWVPGRQAVANQMGVARYLTKPISRAELLEVVEAFGDGTRTVLLVDDDAEELQLFARMLASAPQQYDVLRAKGGQRALDLLRRRCPDLLLLDLVMPGMDGFQVLKTKATEPGLRDIPTVVLSSRDPTGQPIVSDTLNVMLGGGMSTLDLLASVQALGEILTPSEQADRQASPGNAVG